MEKKAREILETGRDKLDTLAENLLMHETLSRQEIDELLGTEEDDEGEEKLKEVKKAAN